MSMELRISSQAEADLAAAFRWYQDRGVDLGVDFVEAVDAAIASILRNPAVFPKRLREYRLAATSRFPYAVYFIWDEQQRFISIRRVLHFSRNAPALLND